MTGEREKEEIGGPEYEAFLKVSFGGDRTATSFGFEAEKFPDLVTKLHTLVEEFRARGVECIEDRPLVGVI